MADKKEFKLEQTKGNFKIAGIIVGLSKDTAYTTGEKDEKLYRIVKFGVKTSPTNIINVELYGSEQEYVYVYSRTEANTNKIAFADRVKGFEDTYHLIGVNVTLPDEEKTTLCDYDASKAIYEGFNDGDSVYVSGELKPNSYVSSTSGDLISNFKYSIKTMSAQKNPIDFNSESFKETSSFDSELIIDNVALDKETDKVLVNAKLIGYGDTFKDTQFAIHNDKNKKLADNFLKLKFGDYIKVLGICVNAPDNKPVVEEDEWGSEIPKGYNTGGKFIKELRITAVDKDKDGMSVFKKKKYKQEDFIVEEEIDDDSLPF